MTIKKAMSAAGTTPIKIKSLGRICSIVARMKTQSDTNEHKNEHGEGRAYGVIAWAFVF